MSEFRHTDRTRLRRLPARGAYDRETAYAILDEALFCHVGFVTEGQPYVIPTIHARAGDLLYVHGSSASRMLGTLADGVPVCVTVTLIDGLVLARSAFHHSINYRSVVILGTAVEVDETAERLGALQAITEHVLAGRWREVRLPNAQELKATRVLRLPLDEASAKMRVGPPLDDAADLSWPCWAGVIPLELVAKAPVPDPQLRAGVQPPASVIAYARRR
jgi:nitroimidazol reductase NimA-like FMN-containing flavoprotein (pyridoxamine 5'-phosphate oxidase superfamily)